MKHQQSVLIAVVILGLLTVPGLAQEPGWSTEFHVTGANGTVHRLLDWNGHVYAAGSFTAIGPVAMPGRVARLRDGAWEAVGDGLPGLGEVAIGVHDGALHAMCSVSGGRQVWRLENDHWVAVGEVLGSSTMILASFDGHLYAGAYRLEDGQWVNRLQTNGAIKSMTVFGDLLIAGGAFTTGGGVATGRVLAWDGHEVLNLFPDQTHQITSLAVWRDQLYAARGDQHDSVIGVQVWLDEGWVDMPDLGHVSEVRFITSLVPSQERLLVVGYWIDLIMARWSNFGGFLKSWDGEQVTIVHSEDGFIQYRDALEVGNDILLAGRFSTVGTPPAVNLGRLVDGLMEPICEPGLGAVGVVNTLAVGPSGLAVGGSFFTVAGMVSRGVALLNGQTWYPRPLSDATNPYGMDNARCLAWRGSTLAAFASGHAELVTGYWSGGQWEFPSYGWFPEPRELVVWGSLMLGAAGQVYNYSDYGEPTVAASVNGSASRLMLLGNGLVVGGNFSAVAGVAAANLAVRQGSTWYEVGGGLPTAVNALGSWQGDLVVARRGPGGDANTNVVMIWEGNLSGPGVWTEIGTLTGGKVNVIQEYAGALFFGGEFRSLDDEGRPMDGIACWTGSRWVHIGRTTSVDALAVYDDKLWVGGRFGHMAGIPSAGLTTFTMNPSVTGVSDLPDASLALSPAAPNPFNPRTTVWLDLPRSGAVTFTVHDLRGRLVRTLWNGTLEAGRHPVTWDGLDERGAIAAAGVYVVRLVTADGEQRTVKVTLAK